MILFFTACERKESEVDMSETFFQEFIADDSKNLDDVLTKKYKLSELKSFFEKSNTNENIGFNVKTSNLSINEVHRQFPIEIIRTSGYSVYKVDEGGYFYVFWVKPLSTDLNEFNNEPLVYFTTFLSETLEDNMFDSLKIGESTAQDVYLIDPSFELSFLNSNSIYSYSFLNTDAVMQISYKYQGEFDCYSDLVVENKSVISRSAAPSRFSSILQKDLPQF